jgi:hypothetical protein
MHQLLVYADNVNILGGSTHTINKNTEALIVASKEISLEVHAEKMKCVVMSRDQRAGQNNIKTHNKSFERVEQFRYLRTTLIHEAINSRLKSGNACYHSVHNILSSSLLSKIIKIKIYRTVILPVLYECEAWSLTLRKEHSNKGVRE